MRIIFAVCLLTLLLGSCSGKPAPEATVTPTVFISTTTPIPPPGMATPAPNLTATKDWAQFQVTLDALKTQSANFHTTIPTITETAMPPIPTPTPRPSPTESNHSAVSTCRRSVDGMRVVNKSFTPEYHNVNGYFSVLNHLSIKPGVILDLVFYGDYDSDGNFIYGPADPFPRIYARPVNQKPYASYYEFGKAIPEFSYPNESIIPLLDLQAAYYYYLNSVRTDNTSDGFFQMVLLGILGGQFNDQMRDWYDDTIVMCNQADIDLAAAETKKYGEENHFDLTLPDQVVQDAHKQSMEPIVDLGKDTATVRIVTFSKWSGFIETRYELTRAFPHQLVGEWQQSLVPYDCGVIIQ
jgi:hypothetical protein